MKKRIGIVLGMAIAGMVTGPWKVQAAEPVGAYGAEQTVVEAGEPRFPEKPDGMESPQMEETGKESRAVTFSDSYATYRVLTEGENPTVAAIEVKGIVRYNPDGSSYRIFKIQDSNEPWQVRHQGVTYAVTEMRGEDLFSRIREVTIPEGVKKLGAKTLWGSDVEQLYLPSTLEQFDTNHALYQLEKLEVSPENPYYCTQDNVLFNKEKSELILYAPGQKQTEYEPPESVKVIKFNAFYNNNYLEILKLPNIEKIEEYAFYGMKNIKDIYFGETLKSYDSMLTIYRCSSLKNVFVDDQNPYGFFDDNGVFYYQDERQRIMFCYPANHPEKSYELLYGTTALGTYSICNTSYTEELIIPATCITIGSWVVQYPNIPITFIMKHTKMNRIGWDAFTCLQPGSQVVFAKEEYTKNIDEAAFMLANEEGYLKADPNPPIFIDYERAVSRINNWYEEDGKAYRYDENGQFLTNGLYEVEGRTYGFDEAGAACSGFCEFAGKTYFLAEGGALQELTGVQELEGNRYYFKEDFSICNDPEVTAWGVTYYLDPGTGRIICDSLSHQFGSWDMIRQATCLQEGCRERTCITCGYQEEQSVPQAAHVFEGWKVLTPASCTAAGIKICVCSVCSMEKKETMPALGHSFRSWTVTKAPGYTAEGQKKRSCSICHAEETQAVPALAKTSLAYARITGTGKRQYTGKPQMPDVTVQVKGVMLKKGTDYSISYRNNKLPGNAVITIHGIGAYTGTKAVPFQIVPKVPTKVKGKAARGKITITFKKPAKASGCEISYSIKQKFTKKTMKKIQTTKSKETIRNLKRERNYYIRIRAYKVSGGKKLYGAYSKSINIRIN